MASETITGIVAEMRELAADIETGNAVVGQTVWRNYADRIEAAAKRERVEVSVHAATSAINLTEEKWKGESGLREAVELCDKIINDGTIVCNCDIVDEARAKIRAAIALFTNSPENENSGTDNVTPVNNAAALREALVQIVALARQDQPRFAIISTAETALAALPRQCDVGTPQEQSRRFCAFCRPRTEPCDGCSCLEDAQHGRCEFIWAQMPYEEGGEK